MASSVVLRRLRFHCGSLRLVNSRQRLFSVNRSNKSLEILVVNYWSSFDCSADGECAGRKFIPSLAYPWRLVGYFDDANSFGLEAIRRSLRSSHCLGRAGVGCCLLVKLERRSFICLITSDATGDGVRAK